MKRFLAIVMMVMMMVTSIGCSNQGAPADSKDTQGKLKIGFVVKSLSDEHWLFVKAGAEAAAKKMDVDLEFIGPNKETDVIEQTSMMEDMISKNVSALCVAPSQPDAAVAPLSKAVEKGIPVLFIDTDAKLEGKTSFIGTGNYEASKSGAQYLAKLIGEGGKVVYIRGNLGDATHDARTKGAIAGFEENGITVLDVQPANSELDRAMNVMENMIQTHGDEIKGVYSGSDIMALGALRAVEQSGKDIKVLGFDGTPATIEKTIAGEMVGSVAQSPYNMGYTGVKEAIKAAKGEAVEERIDTGSQLINTENAEKIMKESEKLLK